MKVIIDAREKDRVESAKKYYTKQGLDVSVQELLVGDYVFDDKVCFELKMMNDFIKSIQDHRVFNQSIDMAETYDYNFVIIVGNESTRAKYLAITRNYRPVTVQQYLGAIASLNRYVTVIESCSDYIEEAYYRMHIQAKKCLNGKPIVKKFPRKDKNACLNFLCHDIHGINYKKARPLVDAYNLKSIEDLKQLSIEDLCQIDGIGENIAKRIKEAHG